MYEAQLPARRVARGLAVRERRDYCPQYSAERYTYSSVGSQFISSASGARQRDSRMTTENHSSPAFRRFHMRTDRLSHRRHFCRLMLCRHTILQFLARSSPFHSLLRNMCTICVFRRDGQGPVFCCPARTEKVLARPVKSKNSIT